MLPYVIGAIQELKKENKVLKRTVEELTRRIEVLEKKEEINE